MSDLTPPRPGNDAPAASAATPSTASRALIAAAAGTTVDPLHREGYAVATNRGYGDAMGRGLELALTLVILGAIGFGIDRLFGTSPVFTIVLSVLGFAGISVKLWLGYDLEMRKHDDEAVWNRDTEGLAPVALPAAPADPTVGAASAVATQLAADAARVAQESRS